LSKAIIDYREKNGPFKSIFELDHVKGIGPRTLERLAPLVTVDPPLPSR
jgi:competence protein ComEA